MVNVELRGIRDRSEDNHNGYMVISFRKRDPSWTTIRFDHVPFFPGSLQDILIWGGQRKKGWGRSLWGADNVRCYCDKPMSP